MSVTETVSHDLVKHPRGLQNTLFRIEIMLTYALEISYVTAPVFIQHFFWRCGLAHDTSLIAKPRNARRSAEAC